MSNTIIQIKRSQTTALPSSLNYGELAYSFQSGKFTIGDSSTGVVVIGGNTYTQMIDAATSANTASTIVKRDSDGSFSATVVNASLWGNANTATKFETARDIYLFGDASGVSSFDGTANANIGLTLATVNNDVGTYGGVTQIPVLTVNAKGLVTSAANVAVATTLNVAGDSGSDGIDLLTDTFHVNGGDGITSSVTANTVVLEVDNTVIRTTGNQEKVGDFAIVGDFSVTGNTTFAGNTSFVDIETYRVSDPLIYLAANNYSSDVVSIGFAANYFDGTTELHTGLFRMPQTNTYYLFSNVSDELSESNDITPSANGFITATLVADIESANVSNLVNAISPSDGGTGIRSYTVGDLLFASDTTTLSKLADVTTGNVLLSGGLNTAPSYGKVGLATHVADVLPVSHGGTNSVATPTAGAIAYGNGTSYLFNTVGSSGQALKSGGTDAPVFGTLDLLGGGLGFTAPNANSAVFYAGSGNSMSYTNTASDGHVLQYAVESGVKFGHLDGGSF